MKIFDISTLQKIMPFSNDEIQTALDAGEWNIGEDWMQQESSDYPLALALTYASEKYPTASKARIAIFASVIAEFSADDAFTFPVEHDPLYQRCIDAVYTLMGVPVPFDPSETAVPVTGTHLNIQELTKAAVQLVENIVFKHDPSQAIRQALVYIEKNIELLEKSKSAFKSKLVAEARQYAEQAREVLKRILAV